MRGAVHHWLAFYACAIGLLISARPGVALAASDTPTDPAPRYLSLSRLDAYLELKADYAHTEVRRSQARQSARTGKQTNVDLQLEERLGLSFDGAVLDPRLLTFGGELILGFRQDHYEERGRTFRFRESDTGHLLHYDLRANLLSGKPLSGTLYGLRQDDRLSRRFQPTLDERRSGFGTSWYFAHDTIPMDLTYDFLETKRTGNTNRADDERIRENTLHYGAAWRMSKLQRLKLDYEHARHEQNFQGGRESFDTTRDQLILDHEISFGPEAGHALRTRLRWQVETGDFARDLFEIGPQLTLKHSDTLKTRYEYQFNSERYDGLDIETHRADVQLVHQLYTNLTTTVDVFGLYENIEDDVKTSQYGGSVDWQYNRRNRFGHLYANLALSFDREESRGDDGRRVVLNESAAFRDPLLITLRNRNVVQASIVVTDSGNRRVYRIGVDYLVLRIGNAVQLIRVRAGLIADGDTVLIDYLYNTPAGGALDTLRVDAGVEQRFPCGLTSYYRLSYRNQEEDTSVGFARRADRTDHHRLGTRFENDRFSLGAEVEIFDDTIDPYDAFHVNGLLHVWRAPDHTLDASAHASRLFFEGGVDDRNVTLIDAELDHRLQLSESLTAVERFAFRYENDSSDGLTHAWDASVGLEYVVGDLSGELTVEYDRLNLPGSNEEDFGMYLRIRRDIRDVLRRQ